MRVENASESLLHSNLGKKKQWRSFRFIFILSILGLAFFVTAFSKDNMQHSIDNSRLAEEGVGGANDCEAAAKLAHTQYVVAASKSEVPKQWACGTVASFVLYVIDTDLSALKQAQAITAAAGAKFIDTTNRGEGVNMPDWVEKMGPGAYSVFVKTEAEKAGIAQSHFFTMFVSDDGAKVAIASACADNWAWTHKATLNLRDAQEGIMTLLTPGNAPNAATGQMCFQDQAKLDAVESVKLLRVVGADKCSGADASGAKSQELMAKLSGGDSCPMKRASLKL